MADHSFTVMFSWFDVDNCYTGFVDGSPFFVNDEQWDKIEDLANDFSAAYELVKEENND